MTIAVVVNSILIMINFSFLIINNNDRYYNTIVKNFNEGRFNNNFNNKQLPLLITINDHFLTYKEKIFSH